RQYNIQADAAPPRVMRTAIGCLHDAGAAAGHNRHLTLGVGKVVFGGKASELLRIVVVATQLMACPGNAPALIHLAAVRRRLLALLPLLPLLLAVGWIGCPRAAEHHDGRLDV